jgi:hypothetical protein
MPEALREEQRVSAVVVEAQCLPAPEGGGADAEVDHHVQDGAAQTRHVLGLAGRHVREVHAA